MRRWVIRIQQRGSEMDDLSEELKVAHTNISRLDDLVLSLQCKVIERDAELAAIKAQEPVTNDESGLEAWAAGKFGVGGALRGELRGNTDWALARLVWSAALAYAAPVSEAKAQEPDCDRSACGDFSPGPCDNPDCSARRDRTVVAPAAKAQGVAIPEPTDSTLDAMRREGLSIDGAYSRQFVETVKLKTKNVDRLGAASLDGTGRAPQHIGHLLVGVFVLFQQHPQLGILGGSPRVFPLEGAGFEISLSLLGHPCGFFTERQRFQLGEIQK